MEKVFYVPGQPWVIDYALDRDGVTVTQRQRHTLEEVRVHSPAAIIITFQEAAAQIEAGCKTEPRQIDAEDFAYGLNVLPPVQWVHRHDCESFKMSECTNGRVTAIYARVGQTFWRFDDICTMPHAQIIAKVHKAMEDRRETAGGTV